MKYLVLLLVLGVAFFWWNTQRKNARRDAGKHPPDAAPPAPPTAANTAPQDMVQCAVCAVHLPRSDAVAGRLGLYCSAEHRAHAEQ